MECIHLSITPAPRGNIASPSHGGDTTFRRGESPAGVASSPEACLAQRRLMVAASWAAGGKESCFVESFLFFLFSEQHTDIWPVLKSSRKSLWFQLPCFKSNAVGLGLVGGRRPEGTAIQSKWAECLYPLYILRFSFHCVPLFGNAMDKMSKSAMVYIKILCVSVVRNRGTQSTALPCGLQLPSLHSHTFQLSWGQL